MGLNKKCPHCGSDKVQMSNEKSKHGCVWLMLFWLPYIAWLLCSYLIGLMLLVFLDLWLNIIYTSLGKGYVWKCRRWFSNNKRTYYCHNCGYNFKA